VESGSENKREGRSIRDFRDKDAFNREETSHLIRLGLPFSELFAKKLQGIGKPIGPVP
jgi:hypothetical protein